MTTDGKIPIEKHYRSLLVFYKCSAMKFFRFLTNPSNLSTKPFLFIMGKYKKKQYSVVVRSCGVVARISKIENKKNPWT